jgi:hypothetical protein
LLFLLLSSCRPTSPLHERADETAELFSDSEYSHPVESAAPEEVMEGSDNESSPEAEGEERENHTPDSRAPKAFGDTSLRKRVNPFKVRCSFVCFND